MAPKIINASTPKLKTFIKQIYYHLISNSIFFIIIIIIPPLIVAATNRLSIDLDRIIRNNSFAIILALITPLATAAYFLRPRKVYLVDFACYNHDPAFLTTKEAIQKKMSGLLSAESLAFSSKLMARSGVGDKAFVHNINDFPPESTFVSAREEAEIVIAGAVDDLMAKTGVAAREIGVVIVNISTFNPVPSLSAMIVNRYKLREDVLSYNLGGMGCSAGLIAVDLAKRLLQVQRNTYALIMSLECPTAGYYVGDDRSKLLSNCLFRMGGAAVLLSNRPSDRRASKYELTHTQRTHRGADDRAYTSVVQEPDDVGNVGISISKDLMSAAGDALKANIAALGPLVLPISEQIRFLATLIAQKHLRIGGLKPYVPDFKLAFEHFCIHSGGKAVLDEVEKRLGLTAADMEPSRMTLYRYSNTSSSSLWYELAYAEAKGRVRKGDRVWQIGFGSGFKCASGVWRALKTVGPGQVGNPWVEVIDQFPISVPN